MNKVGNDVKCANGINISLKLRSGICYISMDDLEEFSDDLKEAVALILRR